MSESTREETPAYDQLRKIFADAQSLDGVVDLLEWDGRVNMPDEGDKPRGDQLAVLARIKQDLITNPRVQDLLASAKEELADSQNPWDRANLAIMQKRHAHESAVPGGLTGAIAKTSNDCTAQWLAARRSGDFSEYTATQQNLVTLKKEAAAALGEALNCTPYDALIDRFDPGMTAEQIAKTFAPVEAFLPGLIHEIMERQANQPRPIRPRGTFPIEQQRKLGTQIITALGIDPKRSRFDIAPTPFTVGVGSPYDVRITTAYQLNNFLPGITGTVHEAGHQSYELGLPKAQYGQPVGTVPGMTAHESMSIFLERMIGRTPEFAEFLAGQAREAFGRRPSKPWSTENILKLLRQVKPGLKRTVADEVTYPAHILLRFEVERRLLSGEMDVADISSYWNMRIKELLGVDVPNDGEGCFQDVHWTQGAFGYFPSYLLGEMSAAQIYKKMLEEEPTILAGVAKGNFAPIFEWLTKKIYSKGGLLNAGALLESATGQPLNPAVFEKHLQERYLA